MLKRLTLLGVPAAAALALGLGAGCGPSTDLTGTPIPNAAPSTRVTGTPPSLVETGFVVRFYWSGYDPDGRVVKYQWKISNNGTNGISIQDTLTFDPVTGDTLNPWFETTATDSTFLVTADLPNFPSDPAGLVRSYQTHTFWVRAVDDKGAVDPSPAHVSFTATTLLPTVVLQGPNSVLGQNTAARLPSTATFSFRGTDPDFSSGIPTKVRYLWKRAQRADGTYISTKAAYDPLVDFLVNFADSAWSPWQRYDPEDETRRISISGLVPDPNIYYLFALQVQDTAGAVSIGRTYGQQVANFRTTAALAPTLLLTERFLGRFGPTAGINLQATFDVAGGQELEFAWSADASDYAGVIVSYRYGWNVADFSDPNDPGWALQPGLSPQHRRTPPGLSFASGVHRLTVQATDNSNQISRWNIILNVVPVPEPADQFPLLLVDDVPDRNSNSWPSRGGVPLDNDLYRDNFWQNVLDGPGGVSAWNPTQHVVDVLQVPLTYRETVQFRSLVWTTRWAAVGTVVGSQFRPEFVNGDIDRYVWLTPYQKDVGNVLYVGSRALISHLALPSGPYEMPVVFQSREGNDAGMAGSGPGSALARRGFGRINQPDGTVQQVGPTRYPFMIMGISVVDIMTSNTYYEYDRGNPLNLRRTAACVGMKGLVVNPDFKATYFPAGGVFPDTIWTDPIIDWEDVDPFRAWPPAPGDILRYAYRWSDDEFYNADIVGRGTPYDIQQGEAWGCDGPCVEPMFHSLARFDWVRLKRLEANPSDTWPDGYYGGPGQPPGLNTLCGPAALTVDNRSARTNNRIVAYIARKTAPDKPSQVGDVVFGFDPYRFDNAQMTRVIRWVLGQHFGLTMNP
jgi:hypothetical protein